MKLERGLIIRKTPPLLRKGGTIGLVAPASCIADAVIIEEAIGFWESCGYFVKTASNLGRVYHQFAGTDSERLRGLQELLDDPSINAIHCMRGGYGTGRILSKIDWKNFLQYPKWIIGYSDITLLLCAAVCLGYEAVHGPLGSEIAKSPIACQKALLDILETGNSFYASENLSPLHCGKAIGSLIGGNLTLLHHLIATPWEPVWKNAILILEDVGEYLYHLDRMIQHFILTQKWHNLAGIIIGSFTDCQEKNKGIGLEAEAIIAQLLNICSIPVISGFPFGHIPLNIPLILGRRYELEATPTLTRLVAL
jgi:muramoyltetrapeptide carboxypeptidase